MKELNEHGDGYEEYYYSEDREPVEDNTDNVIHDDMMSLGYGCQYVNFRTGRAKFIKWQGANRYRIEIDLYRGRCNKFEQSVNEDNSVNGNGELCPFTDAERYLIFKLMDKFDEEN